MASKDEIKSKLSEMSPQQRRLLLYSISAKPRKLERIPRYPARTELPQSYSQRRLWYLYKLDPQSSMYNMPQSAMFRGSLDMTCMQAAFNDVIERHSVLRTVFADDASGPVQRIAAHRVHDIEWIDLSDSDQADVEARAIALGHVITDRPFDLVKGPVVMMAVLRLNPQTHLVVINMHHIVSDGWSVAIFVQDFFAFYSARIEKRAPQLPELPIEFSDFVQWQIERLSGPLLDRQLSFWRTKLQGVEPLILPFDRAPSLKTSARGGYELIKIPPAVRDRLVAAAKESGCTLFMALLAAFKVVLYRYSGQTDINVGVPIAGRNRVETENLIGFFANTGLIRTGLEAEPTFRELMGRVRESSLGAFAHDEAPFEKLVEMIQPDRDNARNPLFQLMFILQNTAKAKINVANLSTELLDSYNSTVKFDMLMEFYEIDGGLDGGLGYRSDLFNKSTMTQFATCIVEVISIMGEQPDMRITDCPIATARTGTAAQSFTDALE